MDLVILGWPCQGLSQACIGQGLLHPHIEVILGVDLGVVISIDLVATHMCICVGKCPTFGGFLATCIGNMATN